MNRKQVAARFDQLHALGCVVCQWDGQRQQCGLTEIHHFLRGGKRIGDHATVPLGKWHHQGVSEGRSNAEMLRVYGPSFHKHTRAFRLLYGADAALLAKVNELIEVPA